MANRRMFARSIIQSDAFTDMPLSTQALYFHLGMEADDDGFVNNPKRTQRSIGASNDDLTILASKGFIMPFESGVVVIKHWRINNYLRNDRYSPTKYQEELALLAVKDNGAYTLRNNTADLLVCQTETDGIPKVSEGYTQYSIGKDSIGKDTLSGRPDDSSDRNEIVAYLNAAIGASFKATTKKTAQLISARMREGFTVDDFKAVIDKKSSDWKGDQKMSRYLRPETLFGTKFEGYLQESKAVRPHADWSKYR